MQSDNSVKNRIDMNEIDQLRKSYELPHHWQLRKEFLQIYADEFDRDRLVCLSNVFVNVECMGLTYPDPVMKSIKELGSKVKGLEHYKHQLEKDEPEPPRKQHAGWRPQHQSQQNQHRHQNQHQHPNHNPNQNQRQHQHQHQHQRQHQHPQQQRYYSR